MQEKRVGDYFVTNEILGSGSFSSVYTSYNLKHQKMAAKVIPRSNIKQNQLTFFEREINLLRRCKNEWIVDFVDIRKSKTNFYLFLEYCQGGNLAEYISRNRFLPENQALRLFSQIVRGMSCLKTLNIIHRDLKPANIMLKNGNIKIVDFGLARKFFSGELMKTYAGSPLNMAPEILKGQPYTQKVDIYSAGTILYQMLYGVSPYEARNKEDLIKEIQKGLSHEKQIEVSDSVLRILREMLQPLPAKRIDLSQLLDFVQGYQKQLQDKRIQNYKNLAKKSMPYFGVLGSVSSPFLKSCSMVCPSEASPYNMDLKMCGRLIEQLSNC